MQEFSGTSTTANQKDKQGILSQILNNQIQENSLKQKQQLQQTLNTTKDQQKLLIQNSTLKEDSSVSSAGAHLKSLTTKDQISISSSAGGNHLTSSPKSNSNQHTSTNNQDSASKELTQPTEAELFIKMFSEMNEKAIESMNKDEPETALEFLKKVDETLKKIQAKKLPQDIQDKKQDDQHQQKRLINQSNIDSKSAKNRSGISTSKDTAQNQLEDSIDPNYKASLYYNLACCYQRLGMLEECVDYLELATKALNKKIIMLEEEENALLFNDNTDPNSIDGDYNTGINNKPNAKMTNRRQHSNYGGGVANTSMNQQVSSMHSQYNNSNINERYQVTTPASNHHNTFANLSKSPNQRNSNNRRIILTDQKKVKKQSREKLLASKLHKLRYQCKFNLQLCAILSQINQHRDALIYGHKSSALCAKLVKEAQLLCKRFMHQIQRQIKREQEKQNQQSNNVNNNNPNQKPNHGVSNTMMSNYNTMIAKNKSGLNQTGLLNDSTMNHQESINSNRNSNGNNTLNNSGMSLKQKIAGLRSNTALAQGITVNYIKKGKGGSRSSVNSIDRNNNNNVDDKIQSQSKRSHSSQSEKIKRKAEIDRSVDSLGSPKSSVTRLRIYKNPFMRDSMNESQLSKYRDRDNSNESLERIHTFSLKNSFQKLNKNNDTAEKSGNRQDSKPSSLTRQSIETLLKKESTEDGQVGGNKTYYVEESVKMLENIIMKADPILSELASKVKQFEKISLQTAAEREQDLLDKYGQEEYEEQRRKLKISFHNEEEINELKYNGAFKMSVRNVLGLRHSDDWIFNLNIGNVMHLSLMGPEELNAKLENTHELCKDSMLEKIVLVSVAYFCIGTEMRFLMQKQNSSITKKDSEAFHAKALHTASLFLPHDCPLVIHIVNSYTKNYLKDKKPVNTQQKRKQTNEQTLGSNQISRPRSRQQTNINGQQQQYGSSNQIQIQNQHQHLQSSQETSQNQSLSNIMTRAGRGKHQQPTQQAVNQSQTISNPRTSMGSGDSQDDTNSNPHSIDAKANRVHSTQISNQLSRPIQMPNNQDFFKQNRFNINDQHNNMGQLQGQGGQPQSIGSQQNKLQIDVNRHINIDSRVTAYQPASTVNNAQLQINSIDQISQLYKQHPLSTKNNSQQHQAFIMNEQIQVQNNHAGQTNNMHKDNPNFQRFINSRPSLEQMQQQFSNDHLYQNFIDIDLSDDINQQQQQQLQYPNQYLQSQQLNPVISSKLSSTRGHQKGNNNDLLLQQQQQINNQLLQQQMQQLNQQINHQQPTNSRSKQVKSQMNQISHIQMTSALGNNNLYPQKAQQSNPHTQAFIGSIQPNHLQQQQQIQQQQQQNNLRQNLRTPTINNNNNFQVNNYNTIDMREHIRGVNGLGYEQQMDNNSQPIGGGITINYHQGQQPINIQILTQQQQQQKQQFANSTQNQQPTILLNPKKKSTVPATQNHGKINTSATAGRNNISGSQLSINQKGKLNITQGFSQTQKITKR